MFLFQGCHLIFNAECGGVGRTIVFRYFWVKTGLASPIFRIDFHVGTLMMEHLRGLLFWAFIEGQKMFQCSCSKGVLSFSMRSAEVSVCVVFFMYGGVFCLFYIIFHVEQSFLPLFLLFSLCFTLVLLYFNHLMLLNCSKVLNVPWVLEILKRFSAFRRKFGMIPLEQEHWNILWKWTEQRLRLNYGLRPLPFVDWMGGWGCVQFWMSRLWYSCFLS